MPADDYRDGIGARTKAISPAIAWSLADWTTLYLPSTCDPSTGLGPICPSRYCEIAILLAHRNILIAVEAKVPDCEKFRCPIRIF
jgi:hypothetical protein